jgi:hypothetical protein
MTWGAEISPHVEMTWGAEISPHVEMTRGVNPALRVNPCTIIGKYFDLSLLINNPCSYVLGFDLSLLINNPCS